MKNKNVAKNYYNELVDLLSKCYAPLTGISVAAIIVTDKGVFKGINYEDSVCSLSMCAERTAIYSGLVHGMRKIYEIHLLSNMGGITMCGACRQLSLVFATSDTKVFTYNYKTKLRTETTLGQLMPKPTVLVKH